MFSPDNHLLGGVRILDLSTVLAGPYCTMILGDLGAEIIKIENPKGGALAGDFSRVPAQYHVGGIGAYFLAINRNEKSLALDLTTEEGRKVFHDLVKVSDVVFDNSRPTVLAKIGADYETLREINPRIISASLSGYGHTGPDSEKPAYDIVVQARGGTMSLTGEPGRPPVRMGLAMGDLAGSLFAAIAIIAALYNRNVTGKGRRIDVALLDCQVSLLTYLAQYYLVGGLVPGPQGSGHETLVPYHAYKAKDGWLVVACPNERHAQNLLRAIGREDLLEDMMWNNAPTRFKRQDEVNAFLMEVFEKKTLAEWAELLDAYQVPWGPVNTIDKALSDPQVLAREMVVEIEHAATGEKYKTLGNPIKASDTVQEFLPAPMLGQHTRQILRDYLGYDEERIEELFRAEIVKEQTPEELEEIDRMFVSLRDMFLGKHNKAEVK
ncbi:MAG: CoA transferase [Actinobacteria bacterium]|nr:CoA transferase [Actinomycetota bacterium]